MNGFSIPIKSSVLFACVLASLIGSSLLQRYCGNIMTAPNCDFYVYYFAGQVVHDTPHGDLYNGATSANRLLNNPPVDSSLYKHGIAAGFDDLGLYIYPPLLADLLVPLSSLPPQRAALLWRGFNLLLVGFSVVLLARMLGLPLVSAQCFMLLVAAYSFWPVHESISVGQITIVLLVLWCGGISAYLNDKMILSAACFALATSLKVTPVLLVPLFILWGERRWVLAYAAALFVFILGMIAVNGPHLVSSYGLVMSAMGTGSPALTNKTLGSLVAWLYYGRIFTFEGGKAMFASQPKWLPLVAKAVSGGFYLVCLALAWRSRKVTSHASRTRILAAFALVTAMCSPVSWRNGYVIAFILLALLWWNVLRATETRTRHQVLLTLTSLTLGTLFFDLAASAPLPQGLKALCAATWVVFSALLCLDVLLHPEEGEMRIPVSRSHSVQVSVA